jgi:hypothetical protein
MMFYASIREMKRWNVCVAGIKMHEWCIQKYGNDTNIPIVDVLDNFGVEQFLWCCRVNQESRIFVLDVGVACVSRVASIFDETKGQEAIDLINRRILGQAKASECSRASRILKEQAKGLGGKQQNAALAVINLMMSAYALAHEDWCTTALNTALQFATHASDNYHEERRWQKDEFRRRLLTMSYDGYIINGIGKKEYK